MSAQSKELSRWTPRHDQVVALHLMGYKNVQIAEIVGFSDSTVGNILRYQQAEKAIAEGRKRIREQSLAQVEEMLVDYAKIGMQKLGETLEGTFAPGSKPKQHQDNVVFKVLDRVGFSPSSDRTQAGGTTLPKESADKLIAALEKAARVDEIHATPETRVVVYDSHKSSEGNGTGEG